MAIDPKTLVTVSGPTFDREGDAFADGKLAVSRYTLDRTPGRLLMFLRGVGTSVSIQTKLAERGYTAAEHERGWALLRASGGSIGEAPPGDDDEAVRAAVAAIDAWDEDGLRVVGASLRNRHPAQHAFVMSGLKASTGFAAVLGVLTLLDRLDALEGAPGREGTREADHAALATLGARGVDAAERARLRALVRRANDLAGFNAARRQAEVDRRAREALVEQRRWLEEWSDMARSVIKRRDWLIRLGLASRRPRGGGPPGGFSIG